MVFKGLAEPLGVLLEGAAEPLDAIFWGLAEPLEAFWGESAETLFVSEEHLADSHGTQASADTVLDFPEEARVPVDTDPGLPEERMLDSVILSGQSENTQVNSFIPENRYSGWENLSLHSWEPLGINTPFLPAGRCSGSAFEICAYLSHGQHVSSPWPV